MRPEVPTSRRCTIPARSAAPEVAMVNPEAARAPRTVGPSQLAAGCAAIRRLHVPPVHVRAAFLGWRLPRRIPGWVGACVVTREGGGPVHSSVRCVRPYLRLGQHGLQRCCAQPPVSCSPVHNSPPHACRPWRTASPRRACRRRCLTCCRWTRRWVDACAGICTHTCVPKPAGMEACACEW